MVKTNLLPILQSNNGIKAVEVVCRKRKKFVLAAMDIFSRSTFARSVVMGRDRLDSDIMEGLRCKFVKVVLILSS